MNSFCTLAERERTDGVGRDIVGIVEEAMASECAVEDSDDLQGDAWTDLGNAKGLNVGSWRLTKRRRDPNTLAEHTLVRIKTQ